MEQLSGPHLGDLDRSYGAPKTAYEITGKLRGNLAEGLEQAEIGARIRQNGCEPVGMTPDATARFVEAERNKWSRVVNLKGFRTNSS